jgi:uncharacterized protein DUF6636
VSARRRLLPAATALGLSALLVAGCGGDDEGKTVTETRTEIQTAGTTATEGTQSAATTETITRGNHGPRYFQTPSQNIGCYLDSSQVRCDIRERSWSPPPKPASCELDWGQGIAVGDGDAEFVCAGDTALGGKATLGYGQSAQRGPFLCESAQDGLTCTNTASGHGFFLSKESYRSF